MPHSKRKTRKRRGHRTAGYGRVGQHRKSGGRGGRGKAGMHKHKWSYTVKYAPDHYGRKGFKSLRKPSRALNISGLRRLLEAGYAQVDESGRRTIDLGKLGYDKLIGGGYIEKPVLVVVNRSSAAAVERIRSAGGDVMPSVRAE
ncbi:MAG: uL15 family ribosomal protein [Candidatus Geothermarchaeales archaeon]